jgi:hypothetical protein
MLAADQIRITVRIRVRVEERRQDERTRDKKNMRTIDVPELGDPVVRELRVWDNAQLPGTLFTVAPSCTGSVLYCPSRKLLPHIAYYYRVSISDVRRLRSEADTISSMHYYLTLFT